MNTAGAVILALVLLLLAAGVGWIVFTRMRASRLGLPPPPLKSYIPFLSSSSSSPAYGTSAGGPSPAPGGLIGWFNDRMRLLRHGRNTRTAAGAYEGAGAPYNAGYSGVNSRGGGGGGHLDPDDAWDTRDVGAYNPYEEERELGLVPPSRGSNVGGEGYAMNLPVTPAPGAVLDAVEEERRGRTRSRSPGPGSGTGAAGGGAGLGVNPFEDGAEPSNVSLRGVSPRPMVEGQGQSFAGRKMAAGEHHDDRRSVFREEV